MHQTLKKEFVTKFLMQDGLCLGNGEEPRILSDGTTAVKNDNGILFAAFGYAMCDEIDGADKLRIYHAVKSLEAAPGLYRRRLDADDITDAHDNSDGIAALSVLADYTFARDICEYGEKYGWSFTNTQPGSWAFKQLRQGGSIAFYKICAGRVPYPTDMLWLCGGLLVAYSKGWSSTWNLAWLKFRIIPLALSKYALPSWVSVMFRITELICFHIAKKRNLFPRSFLEYFGPNHVLFKAALEG